MKHLTKEQELVHTMEKSIVPTETKIVMLYIESRGRRKTVRNLSERAFASDLA